jgi:hypothetical protein
MDNKFGDDTEKKLDAIDLQRLALVTLAVLDLSTEQDIRIRRSNKGIYRVDVMYRDLRQTTHSKGSLLEAMEAALHRLTRMALPLGYASERLRKGFGAGLLAASVLVSVTVGHAATWTCVPPLPPPPGQTAQCTTAFDSTTLADGPHTITVVVTGVDGQKATDSVVVMVDNTPPVLVVTTPVPQGSYKAAGVTPRGTVVDLTTGVQAVVASLDGVPMPVTVSGATWTMAPITKKGGHTLVLTASDGAGNITQHTVPFKIVGGK